MTYTLARLSGSLRFFRSWAYGVRDLYVVDADARADYQLSGSNSLSVRRDVLGKRLTSLHRRWRAETRYSSSLETKKAHPAYASIVAMGDEIVPLILESLATQPDLLVMALHDITHADPVAPDHHGRVPDIVQDWLRWGTERGYRQ